MTPHGKPIRPLWGSWPTYWEPMRFEEIGKKELHAQTTPFFGAVTHQLGAHLLRRNWQKKMIFFAISHRFWATIARSNDPLLLGSWPTNWEPTWFEEFFKKKWPSLAHIDRFWKTSARSDDPPAAVGYGVATHPPGKPPPLADEATRQQRRMRGLGVAEAFGQSFWFWFRFWLTDERSDERVVFLLDETPEGGQVIDVAVGVGQQQLGTHLQLHLDAFAQQRLRKPSVRFFFGQILAPIPYPAKGIPK